MGKKVLKVPKVKSDREKLFRDLYFQYADLPTDVERFEQANTHLDQPQSLRTWKRYKDKGQWKIKKAKQVRRRIPKKEKIQGTPRRIKKEVIREIKHMDEEALLPPREVPSKRVYDENEKNLIIKTICEHLREGFHSVVNLCSSQGVTFGTMRRWTKENAVFGQMYEDAMEAKGQLYIEMFQDAYAQKILQGVLLDEETMTTTTYKFVPTFDPVSGKAVMKEIAVGKAINVRPRQVNHEAANIFIGAIRELFNKTRIEKQFDISDTSHWTMDELEKKIEELESKLETVDYIEEADESKPEQ